MKVASKRLLGLLGFPDNATGDRLGAAHRQVSRAREQREMAPVLSQDDARSLRLPIVERVPEA